MSLIVMDCLVFVELAYYTQRLVADLSCIFANSKENEYNVTQDIYIDTRQKHIVKYLILRITC